MSSGKVTSKDIQKYRERAANYFGRICYFCKKGEDELIPEKGHDLTLTLEHLIPISRGGSLKSLVNHALACYACNNDKGGLTVEEYCEAQGISLDRYPRRGALKVGLAEVQPFRFN